METDFPVSYSMKNTAYVRAVWQWSWQLKDALAAEDREAIEAIKW